VELSAEKLPSIAWATLPGTGPGLYSVIFQVEDASPGSGIALFSAAGEGFEGIGYGNDPNSKLVFGPCTPQEQPHSAWGADDKRPMPYAGPGQWLRLVVAGGMSRCWISSDGIHWGAVFDPRARIGAWRDVGLYLRDDIGPEKPNGPRKPATTSHHIRLRRLQIRELDGLTGAVSAELRRKAAAADLQFGPGESIEAWTTRIAGLAPAGCLPAEWRTACTLQVLAGPVQADAATVLLDRAVAERLTSLPTLQARLSLLRDAALIDRGRPEDVARQAEYWEQLGRSLLQTGSEAEFQHYQKARLESSGGGGLMSASLNNESLLLLYADHRWEELERFEKRLNFWRLSCPAARQSLVDAKLFDWMYPRTAGWVGRKSISPADLCQPLIVPVSRAVSGVFQNLRAALEDRQYKEAARLLTTSYALRDDSLIAAPSDEQLLVSYRGMQRILLHRRKLAEAISGGLDAAARLKVQQTLSQGDPAAIEALTVQYYGTTAHAAACQWLGDRALAGSDFGRALSWFEEGRLTAAPQQQPDLAARVRLASAMLGRLRGGPPTQPVSFGGMELSPEQFERRVRLAAAKQQARVEAAPLADAIAVLPDPQPAQFRFAPWGEFDGGGNGALGQVTMASGDDILMISSRRRAAALDPASGKTRWSWDLGNSPLTGPIYPLMAGQRIYYRSMTAPGKYGIVCLDKKTGRGLWRRDCGDNAAGDPQLFQGRLYVLTLASGSGAGGIFYSFLCLVELDAESGEVLSRSRLAEVSREASEPSATSKPPECQSMWVGNRLVVAFSGAVLCLDLRERVQWLRTSEAIPAEIDPAFHFQLRQMPRESGGRLYLQQPGNCAVQCLQAETGELVWRRGVVGLRRIVDLDNTRLLVQTAHGLTALRAATGEILWRRDLPGLLSAAARNAAGQLLCARQIVQADNSQLALLWIDAATGQTKAHSLLPLASRDPLALGPIVVGGDRAWCCGNRDLEGNAQPGAPGMRIFALRPSGPAREGDLP
jgi:outer membrane protein assembly factor BamB